MREVGVRELKSKLSEILRFVEAGEHVRVTHRGRAIAELTAPVARTPEEHMHLLLDRGRLVAASTMRSPAPEPLEPINRRSATEIVLEDRELGR